MHKSETIKQNLIEFMATPVLLVISNTRGSGEGNGRSSVGEAG